MASSKFQVYNVLSGMCTVGGVNEICELFGLEPKEVEKYDTVENPQFKRDGSVTLSLTLREPARLAADSRILNGRQLYAMPQMVDGTAVMLNKQWSDKLDSSELNELVDTGVQVVSNSGTVTLEGDIELVKSSVDKIKAVIIKKLLDSANRSRAGSSGNQRHDDEAGGKTNSGQEACRALPLSSSVTDLKNMHDKTPGNKNESDTARKSSSSKARLTETSTMHVENRDVTLKASSDQDDVNRSGRSASNASTSSQPSDDNKTSGNPPIADSRVSGDNDDERLTKDANLGNGQRQSESGRPSASSSTVSDAGDIGHDVGCLIDGLSEESRPSSADRNTRDSSGLVRKDYDESEVSDGVKPKYLIDKQVWDYIMFVAADKHSWCRKLTASACKDVAGQVELNGEDADIDEVTNYCDELSRQDGIISKRISIPEDCQFDLFKRQLQDLSQGRVLVNRSDGIEYCELIGIECDVGKLIRSIDNKLQYTTKYDTEKGNISMIFWNSQETHNTSSSSARSSDIDFDRIADLIGGITLNHKEDTHRRQTLTGGTTVNVQNENVVSKSTSVQENANRSGRSASNTSNSSQSSASDDNTPSENPTVTDRRVSGENDDESVTHDANLGNDQRQSVSGHASVPSGTGADTEDFGNDVGSLNDVVSEESHPSSAGWDAGNSSRQVEKYYNKSDISKGANPKYLIDKQVWDYIMFVAADKHNWCRKLTALACNKSAGQVELDGEDADIDKLKKYCDKLSRQDGIVAKKISIPEDCEFDAFTRQLQDLSQGRVLVNRDGIEYCELIGIECDVGKVIRSIDSKLRYTTKYDTHAEKRNISTTFWNLQETQNTCGLISLNVDGTLSPDGSISGNRNSLGVLNSSRIGGVKSVEHEPFGVQVQNTGSKSEKADRDSVDIQFAKYTIAESLWEFVQFSDPDSGWGSKLSAFKSQADGGEVELTGPADNIAELRSLCDRRRLRRAVVTKTVSLPTGCTVETFKTIVNTGQERKILVRATNKPGVCEVIGKKSDVQEIRSDEENELPRIADDDSDNVEDRFKQQSLDNPSAAHYNTSASFLRDPIPYKSTSYKLEFETPRSKVKVSVVTGNIIKQSCEVIVSPANSSLRNNRGLAKQIQLAAGRETTEDCAKYISKYDRLNVSTVMESRSGNLYPTCRRIIHACGPDSQHGSKMDECSDLLQLTFFKCFVCANDDIKAESIAVPAISAGASGLPLDVVCRAAYSGVMSFDECMAKGQKWYLKNIYFVNIDSKTTARMMEIFEHELASSSSVITARGTRVPSASPTLTNSKLGNATTTLSDSLPLSPINPTVQLDKPEFETPKSRIKLIVVTGDILEQHYDVLVCPTDGTAFNISRLTSALQSKAGYKTKDEYDNYIRVHGNMKVTTVMDTGPGNLSPHVERLIYACGPYLKAGSSMQQCSNLLQTTFLNCFIHANDKLKARSVVVPSISPGGTLGLPCDVVAGALSDSLLEFDEYMLKSRDRHLQIICFADLNVGMTTCVNQRFRAKMSLFMPTTGSGRGTDNANLPSSAQSWTNSSSSNNSMTTSSSSSSIPINPTVWSDNPEFVTPKSKIKVVVVTEDILKQRCEIIVCPTVSSLSNVTGLAKTIQSKAGPETMEDCNDYFAKHGYLEVTETMDTRPGRLDPPVKRIIYANGPYMKTGSVSRCTDLLRKTFMKCFVHANDRLKARSIAVPRISSFGGTLSLPLDAVANAAGASLLDFDEHLANATDKHLVSIRFANKDSELTAKMINEFQRKLSTATDRDADPGNRQPQASMQPSAASQPLTELEKRANERGFTVVDVPNDADSALNAIVRQLKDQGISTYDASFLRQQTVAHLRRNPKLIDQGDLYRKHGGDVKLFLQRHSVTGNPFEKSMIDGVAEVLHKEIRVLHESGQLDTFTPSLPSGKHLTVGVDSKWHYVSLRPASDSQTADDPNQKTDEHENKVGKGSRKDNDAHQRNKIADKNSQPHASQTTSTSSGSSCAICMDGIQNPKKLRCGHEFCTDCIDQHFEYQMKCPCCGEILGELKGDQPKGGTMRVSTEYSSLEGYRGCGRIVISYYIRDGIQQANHPNPGRPYKGAHRTAYLPNNAEGQEICALLRRAFDAGLVFTVGRSTTSGQEDVVTWNDIHHKTKPTGPYGYPDPNYLARVRDELAAKGITSATASSTTSGSAAAANHATNSSTNCPPSTSSNYSASSSTSTTSAGAMSKSTAEVDVGRMTTRSMSAVNSSTASTNATTPHRGSTTESSVTYVSSGPLTMHVSDASGSTIDRSDGSSSRPCVIGEPVAERLKKFQTHSDE